MEKKQIVSKKKSFKELLNGILKSRYVIYFKQFSLTVLIYGFLFNFTLYYLFNLNFTLTNLLSLGFLIYFLKEEIPDIVRSCKN